MRYHCHICYFTQYYMIPPKGCRLCGRTGTMVEGPPDRPGFSIAGGLVFDNATGRAVPFKPPGINQQLTSPISSTRSGPYKRRHDPSEDEEQQGEDEDDVVPEVRHNYLLFHTLGACSVNAHGGDGAYSAWMKGHFPNAVAHCQAAHRLEHSGGNSPDITAMCDAYYEAMAKHLKTWQRSTAELIVFNWHIRLTGRPNSWTGRGINEPATHDLINALRKLCKSRNLILKICYTIHEIESIANTAKEMPRPDAVIALNPEIQSKLCAIFKAPVYRSRVPNLECTVPTGLTDRILSWIPPSDIPNIAGGQNLGTAYVLREMSRIVTQRRLGAQTALRHGLAIFGCITGRHGLSKALVVKLADELDLKGVPDNVCIYIAGRTTDKDLSNSLANLKHSRIEFLGEVGDLDFTAHCRYAISFDAKGYRDNASAMVNMIRAGTLLFCRRPNEGDDELCVRAVRTICVCERQDNYLEVLALQQPLFREMNAFAVAQQLDALFALLPT